MSTDSRLWAKIDLGYLSNLKMSDVLDASSNAVCMHLASILHCARELTDGHVSPRAMMRMVGGDASDVELLVKNGLWHEPGHDCETCPQPEAGRVYVHDYLKHNISSDLVERKSKNARKAAQARWNNKKNDAKSNAKSNASSIATRMHDAMQDASTAHADSNATRMQNAMLDIDRDIDRDIYTSSSEFSDENSRHDVSTILERLDQHCADHDFKLPARSKSNLNAARLLLDKDGYTVDQILFVIDWLTADDFWPANIRSATKLRAQFDQLKVKAQQARGSRNTGMSVNSERALNTLQLGQRLMQAQDETGERGELL